MREKNVKNIMQFTKKGIGQKCIQADASQQPNKSEFKICIKIGRNSGLYHQTTINQVDQNGWQVSCTYLWAEFYTFVKFQKCKTPPETVCTHKPMV